MRNHHKPLAAAALVAAALVPAGAAQAATKTVDLGLAEKPSGMPDGAEVFDFFPKRIKIAAGDKVRYRINGLGVVYSGPRGDIPDFTVLDASAPVAGANDPAGAPFWFNGQASPMVDPAVLAGAGDGKVRKGQQDVDHNQVSPGPAKPYTLKFPKPGTYEIVDALHPDVRSTVTVVPKGKRVPSAAADRARAAKQVAKRVKEAKRLAEFQPAAGTIAVGHDSKHVGFLRFFSGSATVPAGTTVAIDAGDRVNDLHNLAIGPADYMGTAAETAFQPGPAGFGLNPVVIYPSQQPSDAPLVFDGAQQGGYVNTGALDTDPATSLPAKAAIRFDKPGTYRYWCLLHSDGKESGMGGTITVE